jgi:hypothetical protein
MMKVDNKVIQSFLKMSAFMPITFIIYNTITPKLYKT